MGYLNAARASSYVLAAGRLARRPSFDAKVFLFQQTAHWIPRKEK
jgi:hypothetical protein